MNEQIDPGAALAAILTQENAALRALDIATVVALADAKRAALEQLRAAWAPDAGSDDGWGTARTPAPGASRPPSSGAGRSPTLRGEPAPISALAPAPISATAPAPNASTSTAPDPARAAALRALVAENRALLERAMAAQGRVIELIAAALRPVTAAPGYVATGARAYGQRVTPCALSARA